MVTDPCNASGNQYNDDKNCLVIIIPPYGHKPNSGNICDFKKPINNNNNNISNNSDSKQEKKITPWKVLRHERSSLLIRCRSGFVLPFTRAASCKGERDCTRRRRLIIMQEGTARNVANGDRVSACPISREDLHRAESDIKVI